MNIQKSNITRVIIYSIATLVPVLFIYSNLNKVTLDNKLTGTIYKTNDYYNYGYKIKVSQGNAKASCISNYNGFVLLDNIKEDKETIVTIFNKLGDTVHQQRQKLKNNFIIRLPSTREPYIFLIFLVGFLFSLFFTIIAILVLLNEKRQYISRPFFVANLAVFSYYFVTFIQLILARNGHEILSGTLFAFHRIGLLAFPAVFFHFCYGFVKNKNISRTMYKIIYLPFWLFLPVLLSWPILGSDFAYQQMWGFSFNNYIQYTSIYTIIFLIAGIWILITNKFTDQQQYLKRKTKRIVTMISLGTLFFITFFVIPQLLMMRALFQGYYYLIILVSQLMFLGTLAYGAISSHLFDFHIIVNRTLLYSTMSLFFAIVYVIMVNSMLIFVKPEDILPLSSFSIFFLFILLEPVKHRLEKYCDKIFFPEHSLLNPTMNFYSENIATSLNKDKLIENTVNLFYHFFDIDTFSFMVFDKSNNILTDKDISLNLSSADIQRVIDAKYIYITQNGEIEGLENLFKFMGEENYQLAIPLIYKNEILGLLAFGRKENIIRQRELELLLTLSKNISLVLFNAIQSEVVLKTEKAFLHADKLSSIGKISASIAHEVKNPLSAIIPLVKVLPDMHSDPNFMDEFMDIVPRQLDKIDTKIRTLLSSSKQSDQIKEESYIEDIINDSISTLSHHLMKKEINIVTDLKKDFKNKVCIDEINSVITNLLINASEAIVQKGTITIKTYSKNDKKFMTINDTGKGIDQDTIIKIFDPFFSTKKSGTGIGLSSCAKIINNHRGTIDVDSSLKEGTTFEITLPLLEV